nr:glycoside hydrolase family 97 protein [Akkermansiaceae bacterium]
PQQETPDQFAIVGELTEFRMTPGATAFSERGHEGEYFERPIDEIDERCELPLLIRQGKAGLSHAILQADAWNYSRRFLRPAGRAGGIGVTLKDPVKATGEFVTPWFVVATAESPGALIEHNYIRDALVADQRPEPDWIVPGKVIRLLDLTTRAGIEGVDFALANGLQYVEYDAGWYGNQSDPKADATTSIPGLDVPAVCEYGRKKGVGVILYVNKIHLELQSAQIFPAYGKWGVKGLKFGFVDGRTQAGINNVHRWAELALRHGMVVDVHDNYRPTGIHLRLPNLLTVEGIRGNEWMPTSRHNVTLPFTRFIAGAGDYTICYLNGRVQTTDAHQLALAVTHFSPLQFVYWYGRPKDYADCMGKEWFKLVPVTWDETRVISGAVGEHYAVARRRGADWFIGGIASEAGHPLKLPLDFLDSDTVYRATIYRDADAAELEIQRDVPVQSGSVLEEKLRPTGGVAIMIRK